MLVIQALWRLRQQDNQFKASLDSIARLKKKRKKKNWPEILTEGEF